MNNKLGCDHLDAPYRRLVAENKSLREKVKELADIAGELEGVLRKIVKAVDLGLADGFPNTEMSDGYTIAKQALQELEKEKQP